MQRACRRPASSGAFAGTAASGPRFAQRWRTACCVAAAALLAHSPNLHAEGTALIRDALLIDGTGRAPQPHSDILIRDGRIASVSPTGSAATPDGALVVDASGKTVIPGVINIRGLAGLVRSPELPQDHFSQGSILRHLASYVSYGVTTTATLAPQPAQLRAAQSAAKTARVVTPVRTICAAIPAAFRGNVLQSAFETVRTPKAARRAVDNLVKAGADFIEFRDTETPGPDDKNTRLAVATVERANRRRLPAAVVTHRAELALAALRAGARVVSASVNDLEVGADLISEFVALGAIYAPALFAESTGFAYEDRPAWIDDRYLRRSLPPGITGQLRGPLQVMQALDPDRALKSRRFDIARRNLRKLAEAGVTIALASGSGFPLSFEGYAEYREAVLMTEAGLSPLEVIEAFSGGSAAALGIDREFGAILPGRVADVVILNANPLDNIHHLRDMHAVFVAGTLMQL
ncbi:MAG: amidohydrolase family protein [Acidobacteriia bacterium]|nr:amidohydrolase family protein [Terriglobia bacterium]MYC64716.1 amidohydrolase family protein [Terriglobia bacterium]